MGDRPDIARFAVDTAPGSVERLARPEPVAPDPSRFGRREPAGRRRAPRYEQIALALLLLVPGALTLYFSINAGGYFAGTPALVAVELALLVALRTVVARSPGEGLGKAAAFSVGCLALFAGWTLLSGRWSHAHARALIEYDRALMYGLVLVFFASVGRTPARVRWTLYGVAAAMVVVCAIGFVSHTLPHVWHTAPQVSPERLGYPLTYWNGLGLLAGLATVFCVHFACSSRHSVPARVLGAAAVPLVVTTLYLTLSRGGAWATVAALVVYLVVGRPRGILSGAAAIVPTTAFAIHSVTGSGILNAYRPDGSHAAAVTVLTCMAAAGAIRVILLPLDGRVERVRLEKRVRKTVTAVTLGGGLALALVLAGTFHLPDRVHSAATQFFSGNTTPNVQGAQRLLNASADGRIGHWKVALADFRANPLHGRGAGTFALSWDRSRSDQGVVHQAHNLYVQVLGELGVVGLVLLCAALLAILASFAVRARGPDRSLYAALFAAGVAWALHAAVDWDWEMPAVTAWLFAMGGLALARPPGMRELDATPSRRGFILRAGAVVGCAVLAVIPVRIALSEHHLTNSIDAMYAGNCAGASAHARQALDAVAGRPEPYQVLAYCALEMRRATDAARDLQAAIAHDPDNWELHYSLSVARAVEGRNPMSELQTAVALNPREESVRVFMRAVGAARHSRQKWERAGRSALIPIPSRSRVVPAAGTQDRAASGVN